LIYVDLPIKDGDFPLLFVCLPEGSQLGMFFPIYGNIKAMFQTTNQITKFLSVWLQNHPRY